MVELFSHTIDTNSYLFNQLPSGVARCGRVWSTATHLEAPSPNQHDSLILYVAYVFHGNGCGCV